MNRFPLLYQPNHPPRSGPSHHIVDSEVETKLKGKPGGNRPRNLLESMGLIEHDTASDGSQHAGEYDTDANAAGVHFVPRVVGEYDLKRAARGGGGIMSVIAYHSAHNPFPGRICALPEWVQLTLIG